MGTAATAEPEKPSDWLQTHFYIPEPRDPETGEYYGNQPGPIRLSKLQCRILDEALSKKIHPRWNTPVFKYTTILWSTIKKSGKSTIASGAMLYVMYHTPYGRAFCLANDGIQSNDILFGPIYTCIDLHQKIGGIFKGVRANLDDVLLPNMARIESLPCDAVGNAGKEPTMTAWSELHGFETEIKRKLYAEMTVPPTRFGRSIRWIETYAGYQGVSELLWDVYQTGAIQGTPHPDFMDVLSEGEPVVRVNEAASLFCYWDHEPRMAWQLGEEGQRYYQQEAKMLQPSEFERLHKNHWVTPVGSLIQPEWWDACGDVLVKPLIEDRTPVVVSVDAATENDCVSLVGLTRNALRPETDVDVIACKIFRPGGLRSTINLTETVGKTLIDWGLRWNIVCVVYDYFQMEKLVQDFRRGQVTLSPEELAGMDAEQVEAHLGRIRKAVQRWYFKFNQQALRAVADKQLYDMIVARQIHWNPEDKDWDIAPRGNEETLTKHIKQAGVSKSNGQFRILKLSNDLKVDGAVSLSMGVYKCLSLTIGGPETPETILARQLAAQQG